MKDFFLKKVGKETYIVSRKLKVGDPVITHKTDPLIGTLSKIVETDVTFVKIEGDSLEHMVPIEYTWKIVANVTHLLK